MIEWTVVVVVDSCWVKFIINYLCCCSLAPLPQLHCEQKFPPKAETREINEKLLFIKQFSIIIWSRCSRFAGLMKFDWMLGWYFSFTNVTGQLSTSSKAATNVMFRPSWSILSLLKFSVFDIYIVKQWNGSSLKSSVISSFSLGDTFQQQPSGKLKRCFIQFSPILLFALCQQIKIKWQITV